MERFKNRPIVLLTLAQVMGILAILFVIGFLTVPAFQMTMLETIGLVPPEVFGFKRIVTLALTACLVWVLLEMIFLCAHVKRRTAFTERNARALGRAALACLMAAILLIPIGHDLMNPFLGGMPLQGILPTFAAAVVALMLRAVQLLLRRAVEMQTDSDLTV
ncbi:MAG: DUF2975 domain-containing protein [Clostridia bacterium]|nr:DUF2975 domain-containing protein [Clostridia bacterium]